MKNINISRSTVEVPKVPKLESPDQWLDWFSTVRSIAQGLEIWHIMDPAEHDRDGDRVVAPEVKSYAALRSRIIEEAHAGKRPSPSEDAIIMLHNSLCRETEMKFELYREMNTKERAIRNVVMSTVRADIYEIVMHRLSRVYPFLSSIPKTRTKHTLRQLLRELQNQMGVTEIQQDKTIMARYEHTVEGFRQKGSSSSDWYYQWIKTLSRAQAHLEPSIVQDGNLIQLERLRSLDLITAGSSKPLLTTWDEFSLRDWSHAQIILARLTSDAASETEDSEDEEDSGPYGCPCWRKKHGWKPKECDNVRFVITGESSRPVKASEDKCNVVRKTMKHPRWVGLRRYYEMENWDVGPLW